MSDTTFSLAAALGMSVAAVAMTLVLGGLTATTTHVTKHKTVYKTVERVELIVHCPASLLELLQQALGSVPLPANVLNLPLGASALLDPLIIAHYFDPPYRCELVAVLGAGSNSATAVTVPYRFEPNVDQLDTLPVHLAGVTAGATVLVLTNYSNQPIRLDPTDSLARLVAPFPAMIERITFRPYAYNPESDSASPTSLPSEPVSASDAKSSS